MSLKPPSFLLDSWLCGMPTAIPNGRLTWENLSSLLPSLLKFHFIVLTILDHRNFKDVNAVEWLKIKMGSSVCLSPSDMEGGPPSRLMIVLSIVLPVYRDTVATGERTPTAKKLTSILKSANVGGRWHYRLHPYGQRSAPRTSKKLLLWSFDWINHISSFFFPLVQGKKAATRDKRGMSKNLGV